MYPRNSEVEFKFDISGISDGTMAVMTWHHNSYKSLEGRATGKFALSIVYDKSKSDSEVANNILIQDTSAFLTMILVSDAGEISFKGIVSNADKSALTLRMNFTRSWEASV